MLSGDDSILQKATEAKEYTERASVIEQAQTDVLGYQAENKGGDLDKTQLKFVLDTYFKNVPSDLPDGEELLNLELTTLNKYGTHQIKVSEIYNGNIQSNSVELKVGDYVKYGEKLTADTYTTDTDETGYTTAQTFTTNTSMLWRVLNVDGNKVELVATQNVLANDNVTGLYLKGQTGFLNAETVLKNLCERLYNSTAGTARSMKVEDINNLTRFNPETSEWNTDIKSIYGRTYTHTSSNGGLFWDENSNEFRLPSASNPITDKWTAYFYTVNENIPLYDTLILTSKTYSGDSDPFEGIYNETNFSMFYWLSSRCVSGATGDCSQFSVYNIGNGNVSSSQLLYSDEYGPGDEAMEEYTCACGVRPIVALKSGISITGGSGTEQSPYEL